MSTNKLLQSLSEDPQLEKQIGCMAGILQLFDRHQVLTGRRLYGHKRIAVAASKAQTPVASNCGSPFSDSCGTPNENALPHSSEEQRPNHASAASADQQKTHPPQTPTTPTEVKSSVSFARAPLLPSYEPSSDTTDVQSLDQLPKISFDIARSNLLAPRRLDSSRSLHEARMNVAYESKVHARKSVDTAERAAAAARGALKDLSRMSSDFSRPCHHEDELSIRDIVRSSLSQGHRIPRPVANLSLSGSNAGGHFAHPQRMTNETGTFFTRANGTKDMSRAHNAESRIPLECSPYQASRMTNAQGAGRMDAPKPPRHRNPKVETPSKTSADISESLRLLAKFRETSPTFKTVLGSEGADDTHRNKYSSAAQNLSHRARSSLAENGRNQPEISSRAFLPRVASNRVPSRMSSCEASWESSVDPLLQGALKSREAPRLSLDGRAAVGGIRAHREVGSQGKLHPRVLLTSRSVSCSTSDCDTESLQEKRVSFSSNVVAKLMGLDEMPNEDPPMVYSKLGLSRSSEQRVYNTVRPNTNPAFIQCGKYVSTASFPSKGRADTRILFDSDEEDEENIEEEYDGEDDDEDGYLHLEPASHHGARVLNVRTGSLKLQGGDRLVTKESGNHLSHPCYQPKNHHLIEDRPPHVLSPAAKLCAQIEEMQRGDFSVKDIDRGTIRAVMSQQDPKLEFEALKQLLGTFHLRKDCVKPYVEKLPYRELPGMPQPEIGRAPFLHKQAEQPLLATWKSKNMSSNEFDSQIDCHDNIGRRISMESYIRKTNFGMYKDAAHHQISKQKKLSEINNQSSFVQAEAYMSSRSSGSSTYDTPRKSSTKISPMGTHNVQTNHGSKGRTTAIHPPSLNFSSSRSLAPPQTPSKQHIRGTSNGYCSWDASSVSSSSSNNIIDNCLGGNSNNPVANKQTERALKRTGVLKVKEENKINLVSGKPRPMTLAEKKAKSEGVLAKPKPDSRRGPKPAEAQNPDKLRSGTRSPTRSAARKPVDVKRKLNFSNRAPTLSPPSESAGNEDQGAQYGDAATVSCIEKSPSLYCSVEPYETSGNDTAEQYELANDMVHDSCMPADYCDNSVNFSGNTPTSIDHARADDAMQSPQLLDGLTEAGIHNQDGQLEIINRKCGEASDLVHTSKGALRLLQASQQLENEDTESQGDKSTESCEQPSPVSVLEGPFYEEDSLSTPATNKFVLKLEELEEEARGTAGAGSPTQRFSAPALLLDANIQNDNLTDHEYVRHLLKVSCLQEQTHDKDACHSLGMWKLKPLESHHLLQLEEETTPKLDIDEACGRDPAPSMPMRKLLLDSVKASLDKKLHIWRLCQNQPWLLACECGLHGTITSRWSAALRHGITGIDKENKMCLSSEGGEVLLEEVWEEIKASMTKQRCMSSKTCTQQGDNGSICRAEEEEGVACDDAGHMFEEDILDQSQCGGPDVWVDLLIEKGELGLDLERLIFKDLIDHTIRDLGGVLLHSSSSLSTKRQLFKLHT